MHLARPALAHAAAALLCAIPASTLAAQSRGPAAGAPQVNDSVIVSSAWLASRMGDPNLVVIQVVHDQSYGAGHIPGARELSYTDIVVRRDSLGWELPPPDRLQDTFERLGVSDDSRVIVYGDDAPMNARVLFTLDYLGHSRWAMLDGGLAQWRAEGRPVTLDVPQVERGRLTTALRPSIVATADEIVAGLGKPGVALIDTRTDGEYLGTAGRRGMPSAGHLEGARQLEWQWLVREGNASLLRDRAELQRLYAERVRPGDAVITYCWVGFRASATWLVARHLGYSAKLYDGSYQDWMQRDLPVKAGREP